LFSRSSSARNQPRKRAQPPNRLIRAFPPNETRRPRWGASFACELGAGVRLRAGGYFAWFRLTVGESHTPPSCTSHPWSGAYALTYGTEHVQRRPQPSITGESGWCGTPFSPVIGGRAAGSHAAGSYVSAYGAGGEGPPWAMGSPSCEAKPKQSPPVMRFVVAQRGLLRYASNDNSIYL
jgi:hypothetical protein